ncbi:MAG: hypothetical protein R3F11_11140 [Verrucomicrobiales bacterium]
MTKNLIIAALLAAVAWLAGQLYWQDGEVPRQAPPVDAGTQAPAALPSPPAAGDETAVPEPEPEPEPLPEPDRFQGIRDTLDAMGGDPGLAGMAFGFARSIRWARLLWRRRRVSDWIPRRRSRR